MFENKAAKFLSTNLCRIFIFKVMPPSGRRLLRFLLGLFPEEDQALSAKDDL